MRIRIILLMAMAAALAGCGDYSNEYLQQDLEFLYSVPAKSTLEIRVAASEKRHVELFETSSGLTSRTDAVLGDPATWYAYTVSFSGEVNSQVFNFLDMIDLITSFPPTARDTDIRMWGPWPSSDSPHTDWRFVMSRRRQPGVYDFSLQVNAAAKRDTPGYVDGWQDCLSGSVSPSQQCFRRGTGNLKVDVWACNQYENTAEQGSASIIFDTAPDSSNPDGKTHLSIQFTNFISKDMYEDDPDPQPVNALYTYNEEGDFSGLFDFAALTDLDAGENPDRPALEQVTVKVRWNSGGAGRADSRWSGGDLGAAVIDIHECWNEDKNRVYYEDSYNMAPTEGNPADCAMDPVTFD
ncbi:MAG TPA: hypothetical protein VM425_04700 [Myxococcota bacterium]|nr:hypothetical protein [Myxococcota bacterium]